MRKMERERQKGINSWRSLTHKIKIQKRNSLCFQQFVLRSKPNRAGGFSFSTQFRFADSCTTEWALWASWARPTIVNCWIRVDCGFQVTSCATVPIACLCSPIARQDCPSLLGSSTSHSPFPMCSSSSCTLRFDCRFLFVFPLIFIFNWEQINKKELMNRNCSISKIWLRFTELKWNLSI